MHIKKINIVNFRSIKNETINLDQINVFYGLNDVGKSNVLKAMNLFFNGNISHNEEFDFDKDFCNFSTVASKKAKEIKIRITLSPPSSYKDNEDFVWEKTWRKGGLHKELFNPSPEDTKEKKVSAKYTWARKLKYRYVPAMKDNLYFSVLLRELYDILSESISENLLNASNKFVNVIKKSTKDMSDDLQEKLGFKSEINFPDNLGHLFSTLDFYTEKNNNSISLRNRGDGIKIRHIPSILYFFHVENNKLNDKGSIRTDTIWGYEEPENNLEGLAAFHKAEQFKGISKDVQVLLTTHSPAFYLLKENHEQCKLLHAVQQEGNEGTKYYERQSISHDPISSYDKEFLALIAPFVKEYLKQIEETNSELDKLKNQIKDSQKDIVFVEGQYDIDYINKAASFLDKEDVLRKIELKDAEGFGNLDKIWKAFDNRLPIAIKHKILLLYDCDIEKKDAENGNVIKVVIPREDNNEIKIGIENLIPNSTLLKIEEANPKFIDIEEKRERKIRGNKEIIPRSKSVNKNEKRNLCNWMCENGNFDDFKGFERIFEIIEQKLFKNNSSE